MTPDDHGITWRLIYGMPPARASERWRPVRIGVFYYAMRGIEQAPGNHVMREACAARCAKLNGVAMSGSGSCTS